MHALHDENFVTNSVVRFHCACVACVFTVVTGSGSRENKIYLRYLLISRTCLFTVTHRSLEMESLGHASANHDRLDYKNWNFTIKWFKEQTRLTHRYLKTIALGVDLSLSFCV